NALDRAVQQLQTDWYRRLQNKINNLPQDVQIEFERQKQLYRLAQQQQWFLDDDLVNHLLDLNIEQNDVFNNEAAIEYITEHFDSYITTITSANCYKTHKNIILQSSIAFSNQQYELAIFPLFAAFDNVISRWYKGELSQQYEYTNVFTRGLWNEMSQMNEVLETMNLNDNRESNKLLKGLNIIQAYLDLFTTYPENIAKLNRNSILHGSYNYSLLSATSYFKMVVLLQSAISLEDIPFQSMP
ncbi:hypothetical protein, partial [Metabacillus fastidiosus]|uniref:hypothetical protein n=1 Tax=Metabacillus fastidiosus TaxID=1458 RepID=UPI002DC00146